MTKARCCTAGLMRTAQSVSTIQTVTAFKEGDYYFGGEDDGAMTTGWLQMDVTYDEATNDDYEYIAPAFNDDEDQTRWFYFKSNGKKVKADRRRRNQRQDHQW